ncbi:uncharacterized protein GVI51_D02695 [Nakaseomyces glabratus]|uniref:uncharacterized protein n=1 Tax=Candida glabrata TaxID=5478 RepID=UPI00138D8BBB|nr:hypothetical protein J7293_00788 [Nakaseomyces glabratus]KAH7608388.1 hypothetical protein J7294_00787 [Nakaseomyces glabratus]QHS65169.1 uncharacterized protein GVI51_D02695 [Nakaseomyces glabratus]
MPLSETERDALKKKINEALDKKYEEAEKACNKVLIDTFTELDSVAKTRSKCDLTLKEALELERQGISHT